MLFRSLCRREQPCGFPQDLSELGPAVLHLRQDQIDPLLRPMPVIPADSFGHHRAGQDLRLRKTDLIVQSGTSGMVRLTAEQRSFYLNSGRIRHFPGSKRVLVREGSLLLSEDAFVRNSLLS